MAKSRLVEVWPTPWILLNEDVSLQFELSQYNVSEEQASIEICVVLRGMTDIDVVATISLDPSSGTASPDSDFEFSTSSLTFTSSRPRTLCSDITIEADSVIEDSENIVLSLSSSTEGNEAISQANVVILDSSLTTISLISDPVVTLVEGKSELLCFMSSASLERSVTLFIDFNFYGNDLIVAENPASLTITPGQQMSCVSVEATDDQILKDNEEFALLMTESDKAIEQIVPDGGQLIISDNDRASISFTETSYSVMEGDDMKVIVQVLLTLEENATLERNISMDVSETFRSASVLDILLPVSGLTFCAGDSSGQTLNVMGMVSSDGIIENDESLTLSLSPTDILTDVVFPRSADVSILSPDSATFAFTQTSYIVYEHELMIDICIELVKSSDPLGLRQEIQLAFRTADITAGSGVDYSSINDILKFQTHNGIIDMQCREITVVNDSVTEPNDELFSVILEDPMMLDDVIILGAHIVNVTISDSIPPRILAPPKSINGMIGDKVVLSCLAKAKPPPQYSWMILRGVDQVPLETEVKSTLTIPSLMISDRGVYFCKVSNVLYLDSSDEVIISIKGIVQYTITLDFGDRDEVKENCSLSIKIEDFLRNNITLDSNLGAVVNVHSPLSSSECDGLKRYTRASELSPSILQLGTTLMRASEGSVSSRKLERFLDSNVEFKKFGYESLAVTRYDGCPEETFEIVYFDGNSIPIKWPESEIGQLVTLECPCGSIDIARTLGLNSSRVCRGDFVSQAFWEAPDVTACLMLDFNLCEISQDPPRKRSAGINTFIQQEEIDAFDLTAVSLILERLADTEYIVEDPVVLDNSLSTIDGILNLTSTTVLEGQMAGGSSERIMDSIELIASMVPLMENASIAMLERKNFAILSTDIMESVEPLVIRVELDSPVRDLNDLRQEPFSVESGNLSTTTSPAFSVELNKEVLQFYLATVNYSSGLRLFSVVYEANSPLFQDVRNPDTGSIIVSVGCAEGPAPANLSNPVMLIFEPIKDLNPDNNDSVKCVFWNALENDGTGGWSDEGCVASSIGSTVVCLCDHLTSFTVLLNVNHPPPASSASHSDFENSLTVISYVGAIISSLFLIITVTTYLLSSKLRSTQHGQLLIQMCLSLVGLYISFLISSFLGSNYDSIYVTVQKPICITFSALVHYFFLVYFFITVSQSVLMYLKLVKVLGGESILSNYFLKVGLVVWLTPLIVVVLFLGFTHDYYIQQLATYENVTTATCFPSQWPLYLGVISPFAVIYIFNLVMLIIILASVLCRRKNSGKEDKAKKIFKKFIITLILAVMFGIGWIFGVLGSTGIPQAISYPCQIIFVIIVGFQGLLVFLLHPCRSKEAREEWSRWFYYAICRSQTYRSRRKTSKVSHSHSENSSSAASRTKRYEVIERRNTNNRLSFISLAPRRRPSNIASISSTTVAPSCPSKRRSSDVSLLGAAGIAARFGLRHRSDLVSADSQKLGHNVHSLSTSPSPLKKIDELLPSACSDSESSSQESLQVSNTSLSQPRSYSINENQPLPLGNKDGAFSSHCNNKMQYVSNDDLMSFSPT